MLRQRFRREFASSSRRRELAQYVERFNITHHAAFVPLDLDPRRVPEDQIEATPILE